MDRAYKNMQEVVVTNESPVTIKGDTIAFNANMFKTKPNATVEDLLKKMPGMQVEKDGTVKAQGETVQKVYVDGKEFFNNDPKLATKNLAADMIDQVEVFDDMSEQAKFNRIDDGSRSKAINLKLKKDKKKGILERLMRVTVPTSVMMQDLTPTSSKGLHKLLLLQKPITPITSALPLAICWECSTAAVV